MNQTDLTLCVTLSQTLTRTLTLTSTTSASVRFSLGMLRDSQRLFSIGLLVLRRLLSRGTVVVTVEHMKLGPLLFQ